MSCQRENWKLNVFYPEVYFLVFLIRTLVLVIESVSGRDTSNNVSL